MKAIMVMFDSLNRRMLEPYGCDWVQTPNFKRLAERAVTFDNAYVGSMPCMPARRELHTGRYNFLHASWGPVEPFDDSMPEILKDNGVYSHLISDHYHYWEDGGATYHSRFSSWELVRGQEFDAWKPAVKPPEIPETVNGTGRSTNYWTNRVHLADEKDHYQTRTFGHALEFLEQNHDADNWFLQVETFDPHEPYFAPERFRELYPKSDGKHFDWPPYRGVQESPEEVERCRRECAALHTMCDESLGKILDVMDTHDLWKDTLLIVNTDHGFLLGEHGCWAKCWAPFYNEVAHTPLFVWDPRSGVSGERRQALVQTIDLAPTLLDYFDQAIPPDMQGVPLKDTVARDAPVREAALFGLFGGHVNCTDGRYVYMRGPVPENAPLNEYTLMPTEHGCGRAFMPNEMLATAELSEPFAFTKGLKTLKVDAKARGQETGADRQVQFPTALYDLEQDPDQQAPIDAPKVEARLCGHLTQLMRENDAPPEQFTRLGLSRP
jgi:arylsulfatase A-like enzyme